MIALDDLAGKKFAVILVDQSEGNDDDWVIIGGRAEIKDGRLYVERGTDVDFPIPPDTYERIKAVSPQIAEVVGDADYVTMLTIGPSPDEKNA